LVFCPFRRCGEACEKLTADAPAVSDLDAPVCEATAVAQTRDQQFGRTAGGHGPKEIDVEGVEGKLAATGRQEGRTAKRDASKAREERLENTVSRRFATQELGERI
jgi:hypothetical protein